MENSLSRLGECGKRREFFCGSARSESRSCELCTIAKIRRNPSSHKRRSGIHENDVALRPGFARKYIANCCSIFLSSPAAYVFNRGSRYSEIFRCHCETPHASIFYFGN